MIILLNEGRLPDWMKPNQCVTLLSPEHAELRNIFYSRFHAIVYTGGDSSDPANWDLAVSCVSPCSCMPDSPVHRGRSMDEL